MFTEQKDEAEILSQSRYDLDNKILTKEEITLIKNLAKEKRVDYGIAPIGVNIFRLVREKEPNLYFEREAFDNKDLDALIYLPKPNKDLAFIILNSNQPLLNQVFATAHEYYHYIKDLEEIRFNPRVCSLSSLKEKIDQKASRFAAEFLLPDEALRIEIQKWLDQLMKDLKEVKFTDVAILCYALTIKYGMPLKAVLFRLHEENCIGDISNYLFNFDFLKRIFVEYEHKYSSQAREFMSAENSYIEEVMYDHMLKAYEFGYITFDTLKNDLVTLKLKTKMLDELEPSENGLEDEEPDPDLKANLIQKLHGQV
jgi:Zn-dependent peptidase ImmA (M78 family)